MEIKTEYEEKWEEFRKYLTMEERTIVKVWRVMKGLLDLRNVPLWLYFWRAVWVNLMEDALFERETENLRRGVDNDGFTRHLRKRIAKLNTKIEKFLVGKSKQVCNSRK